MNDVREAFSRLRWLADHDGIRDTAIPGPAAALDISILSQVGAIILVGRHVFLTDHGRDWLQHPEV